MEWLIVESQALCQSSAMIKKIPNRLRKMPEKPRGYFFDSRCRSFRRLTIELEEQRAVVTGHCVSVKRQRDHGNHANKRRVARAHAANCIDLTL